MKMTKMASVPQTKPPFAKNVIFATLKNASVSKKCRRLLKHWQTAWRCVKKCTCRKMPLNIRIQWNAGTACVLECVLKTLACRVVFCVSALLSGYKGLGYDTRNVVILGKPGVCKRWFPNGGSSLVQRAIPAPHLT